MKKILVMVGTRPEAIKMAPVVHALKKNPEKFDVHLCSSGQHGLMLSQTLDAFGLAPDSSLDVMTANQNLAGLSSRLFTAIDEVLERINPYVVLVQGDTTTVQVAAQCAFYRRIPVGHVEAGLRTGNMHAPFPEELNRRIVALAATWHYAPTETARQNLLDEKIPNQNILVTGNTVIDALYLMQDRVRHTPPALPAAIEEIIAQNKPLILVTGHRRENFGKGVQEMCDALTNIASTFPEAKIVYPVHLNPNVRGPVLERLGHIENIILEDPQPYAPFVRLLDEAKLILTDSGGIQEEGVALGKPVLIMRETTERPEGVRAGKSVLVGTNPEKIIAAVEHALKTQGTCERSNIYGDGKAAERIAEHLDRQ